MLYLLIEGIDAPSKVRVTKDEMIYAVDLVMVITEKNRDDAGKCIRNIDPADFPLDRFKNISVPGKGGYQTKVVSFKDAINLVMVLPGKQAKKFRMAVVDVLVRYLQGDVSLHEEIEENREQGIQMSCQKFLNKAMNTVDKESTLKNQPPEIGWVYGTYSEAFPGLIKIGRSNDLDARISSGNTFCAPAPHKVVAGVPSFNPTRDEKMAHQHFAECRAEGEFFRTTKEEVQAYFDTFLMPVYNAELAMSIEALLHKKIKKTPRSVRQHSAYEVRKRRALRRVVVDARPAHDGGRRPLVDYEPEDFQGGHVAQGPPEVPADEAGIVLWVEQDVHAGVEGDYVGREAGVEIVDAEEEAGEADEERGQLEAQAPLAVAGWYK